MFIPSFMDMDVIYQVQCILAVRRSTHVYTRSGILYHCETCMEAYYSVILLQTTNTTTHAYHVYRVHFVCSPRP